MLGGLHSQMDHAFHSSGGAWHVILDTNVCSPDAHPRYVGGTVNTVRPSSSAHQSAVLHCNQPLPPQPTTPCFCLILVIPRTNFRGAEREAMCMRLRSDEPTCAFLHQKAFMAQQCASKFSQDGDSHKHCFELHLRSQQIEHVLCQ